MNPFSAAKSIVTNALSYLPQPIQQTNQISKAESFSFGDAVPVLDGHDLSNYMECWFNGRWYEPQVSLTGLSKSYKATPYLSSGIIFKRNFLANLFIPHPLMSRKSFEQLALDFIWCGNTYVEDVKSRLKSTMEYKPALAKYTRAGEHSGQFFYLNNSHKGYEEYEFPLDRICHIRETDIDQEIYGTPEYISALQSAWLNESATLFRRKYYNNGSHAGFILYVNDPASDPNDITALRTALKESKGPGNFRNLFYYSPNGKKDGIQVIPTSEIAAKDDFTNIKSITRDDTLAALRIPPQLMGIVPNNAGGFGDIKSATEVFYYNEIIPLQSRLLQFNEWAGYEVIKFKEYGLIQKP
ncbi:phage portal protein [Acinetobacter baumannii]|uniref:phage portal protein n=1 Tax=Acinetobacter baumannii TaxID=470 RepID=UPI0003B88710|nr:phage portal protein [Acinetobacter baumannii]MBF6955555.1 phage portal protein [Acinetobacter baumannii]MCQ9992105.1 phage portal protein [Acinetobacter baumannii]MDC4644294.1 phage portal protein [Acinetobacter baumannii]MDC5101320.1 phage portal protein [Acinetobacter baumannii]MDH2600865.1 phage portal protein [Acinetobacter baumannii]